MRMTRLALIVTVCLIAMGLPFRAFAQAPKPLVAPATASSADLPLTNAEVVNLCKLDLGDEVVIAKINQAKAIDFKLETDDIVALKRQGISKDVIAAMLKRATPQDVSSKEDPISKMPIDIKAYQGVDPFRILTSTGEIPLKPSPMEHTEEVKFGFIVPKMNQYLEAPGTQSRTRTKDKGLCILVTSEFSPEAHFFLVRLKIDSKRNSRSMKMDTSAHLFGNGKIDPKPEEDSIVAGKVERVSDTEWRLVPKVPLMPGEYWIYTMSYPQGNFSDFGVD